MKRARTYTPEDNSYLPLLILLIIVALSAYSIESGQNEVWSWRDFMHTAMGLFLAMLAMFKFFDLEGFSEAFGKYDLIASRYPVYGYVYPFLEVLLALAYLSFSAPKLTYLVTIAVMSVGSVGVVQAIRDKRNMRCACMGTLLKVPLSTVTIVENGGMGLMAIIMLLMA